MITNRISLRSIRDCIHEGIPHDADRQRIADFLSGVIEQAESVDGKVSGDTKTQSERDRENTNGSLRRKSAVTAMMANGFHWNGKAWVKTRAQGSTAKPEPMGDADFYRNRWNRVIEALHKARPGWLAAREVGVEIESHAAATIMTMRDDLQRLKDRPDYFPHYKAWGLIIELLNERAPDWCVGGSFDTFADRGIAALRNLTKPESPYGQQAHRARLWDQFAEGFSDYFPNWFSESNATSIADRALNVIGALRARIAKHEDQVKSLKGERDMYRTRDNAAREALDKVSPGWMTHGLNNSVAQDVANAITKLGEQAKANQALQSPSYAFQRVVDALNKYGARIGGGAQCDLDHVLAYIRTLAHAKPRLTHNQCREALVRLNRWSMSYDARNYGMPLGVYMDEGVKTLRNALEAAE